MECISASPSFPYACLREDNTLHPSNPLHLILRLTITIMKETPVRAIQPELKRVADDSVV